MSMYLFCPATSTRLTHTTNACVCDARPACAAFTQTFPKSEWSPALRRLANNSFDVFASVQECLAKDVNPVSRVVFVQQRSKLYRAFMHEQVDLLRKRQGGDSGAGEQGL